PASAAGPGGWAMTPSGPARRCGSGSATRSAGSPPSTRPSPSTSAARSRPVPPAPTSRPSRSPGPDERSTTVLGPDVHRCGSPARRGREVQAVSDVRAVVVGGGIAGVSVAAELAGLGAEVTLLEAEDVLAHHTTGRSAAMYLPGYGNAVVRALT